MIEMSDVGFSELILIYWTLDFGISSLFFFFVYHTHESTRIGVLEERVGFTFAFAFDSSLI
jgi:hypothetical protein